ncbi:hypothetical protein GCM10022223_22860 [Kineosporia mesophila]|uniref:Uncharacterized protein n=1 Tax=Kineosporia mesophila TaxID=566012 RepID=A0ABP6ZED6_9ACTN
MCWRQKIVGTLAGSLRVAMIELALAEAAFVVPSLESDSGVSAAEVLGSSSGGVGSLVDVDGVELVVGDFVGDLVGDFVGDLVGDLVGDSVVVDVLLVDFVVEGLDVDLVVEGLVVDGLVVVPEFAVLPLFTAGRVVVVTTRLPWASVVVVTTTSAGVSPVAAPDGAPVAVVVGTSSASSASAVGSPSAAAGNWVPSAMLVAESRAGPVGWCSGPPVTAQDGTAMTTAAATPPTIGRRSNRGRGARCLPTYLMARSRLPDLLTPYVLTGRSGVCPPASDSIPEVHYALYRAVPRLCY